MNKFTRDWHDFEHLQGLRVNFDWLWQRISDYVIPRRGDFTITRFQGQRRDYEIYDTTAPWALEQLAAGLHTLLTTQALPWFYLRLRDDALNASPEVQAWIQDVQNRINAIFNDPLSRFQSQIHEFYTDLAAFGTAVMDVQYNKGVKFTTRFLGNCFIAQTHYGEIDTLYRTFGLEKYRAIEVFGEKNLPAKILKIKDDFELVKFLHAVVPSENGRGWDSRYYAIDYQALVREGHFDSFPYIVSRWAKSSIEDYGRSPAMRCLGDILMVNEQKRSLLRAAHKAVDPPLLLPDGGFMQPINLKPGAANYYDTSVPGDVKYLESKSQFPIGEDSLRATQEAIIRAFYVDMLQLPGGLMPGSKNQNTYMTATEAMIRRDNAMRVLGPIVSRLQNELLNPLIVRVFDILRKQRSLPQPPAVLKGDEPIEIEYVSPLAIAQEGAEVDKWTRFWTQLEPVATIDPNVLDSVNFENIGPYLAKHYHLDANLIRTPQQVRQIQQQRQQQQALEQQSIAENNDLVHAKRNTEAMKMINRAAGQA